MYIYVAQPYKNYDLVVYLCLVVEKSIYADKKAGGAKSKSREEDSSRMEMPGSMRISVTLTSQQLKFYQNDNLFFIFLHDLSFLVQLTHTIQMHAILK